VDRLLETLRFAKATPYIPRGARVLDIGTGDGAFLRHLTGHIRSGVGIDANLPRAAAIDTETCRLVRGAFPKDLKDAGPFDVITLLATVEHIPMDVLPTVAAACWEHLTPGGQVVITVPQPEVDGLLHLLKRLRLVEGFSMHEHYGFDPACLPDIFNHRWQLLKRDRWGLGCNNLFVFGKPSAATCEVSEDTLFYEKTKEASRDGLPPTLHNRRRRL